MAGEPNVMWDREVEHGALLLALETIEETREAVHRHARAKKTLKQLTEGWATGERVKVGVFIVEIAEREGGGKYVEPWTARSATVARASYS